MARQARSKRQQIRDDYYNEVVDKMKHLGIYSPSYNNTISVYADMLTQYDELQNETMKNNFEFVVDGKKNPLIYIMETLRKDLRATETVLGLNVKSYTGIRDEKLGLKEKRKQELEGNEQPTKTKMQLITGKLPKRA